MKTGCKRILIVEDETDARETLKDLLELEGFSAGGAANGQEALRWIAEREAPCMILLDLMMPVMNGWQFLDELHKHHQHVLAATRVVVVSAAADVGAQLQSISHKLMRKPIDIDELLALAREYC